MLYCRKPSWKQYIVAMSITALAILSVGCSDDNGETSIDKGVIADTLTPKIDQGVDSEVVAEDQGAGDSSVDVMIGTGKATDVELGLHNNNVKIVFSTMTVSGEQVTEYDLFMAHDAVDSGPNLKLGPGVTAINLGSADEYHAVNEAPDSGYEADDDQSLSWVIGSSWRTGGDGTEGFIMSEDVYVLKLADGSYGKIEVLSAQGGIVHVLCYHQSSGDRDITTEE